MQVKPFFVILFGDASYSVGMVASRPLPVNCIGGRAIFRNPTTRASAGESWKRYFDEMYRGDSAKLLPVDLERQQRRAVAALAINTRLLSVFKRVSFSRQGECTSFRSGRSGGQIRPRQARTLHLHPPISTTVAHGSLVGAQPASMLSGAAWQPSG
jgi:hypothetical protein